MIGTVGKTKLIPLFTEIENVDQVLMAEFEEEEMDFITFTSFGHTVSSVLADKWRMEDYKKFIHIYNQVLKNEFQETLELINSVYTNLSLLKSFLSYMLKPDFAIKDVTDIFRGREFKLESELERILYESLTNWSHQWSVKRQRHIGSGLSDITILQKNEKVAIELKKGKAQRKDVYQTLEYTTSDSDYVGVLIASGFDEDVLSLANQFQINCFEYQLATPVDGTIPDSFYLEQVNNARQKTLIEHQILNVNECDGHLINFEGIPKAEEARKKLFSAHRQFNADLGEVAELLKNNQENKKCCPHCGI